METVPLASADLVRAGVFPSISPAMQEHLLAADRTIRDLQSELARRDPAGSWWTGGVCLETLPQGQIRVYVAAYVYPRAVVRDLSFEVQFFSELPGTWQIEAGVWVQSIAAVDTGQECAAEIALSTERTPEAAVEAYSAGALALAEAALSREPLGEAWRAN